MGENVETRKGNSPKNFRISDDVANKFRKIVEEGGFSNQDAAFAAVIDAFEREGIKEYAPQHAKKIEEFQQLTGALSGKFVGAVKSIETAEERIRQEYAKAMESKDETIVGLQEETREIKRRMEIQQEMQREAAGERDQAKEELGNARERIEELEKSISEIKTSTQSTIRDKEKLINVLTDKIRELETEVREAKTLKDKIEELRKVVESEMEKAEGLRRGLADAEDKLKESEYQRKLELLDLKEKYENQINNITAEKEKQKGEIEERLEGKIQKIEEENEGKMQKMQERYDDAQNRNEKLQRKIEELLEAKG